MALHLLPNGHDPAHSTIKMANLGSHGWYVQKYGGTSIARYAEAIVEDIVRCAFRYDWSLVTVQALRSHCYTDHNYHPIKLRLSALPEVVSQNAKVQPIGMLA